VEVINNKMAKLSKTNIKTNEQVDIATSRKVILTLFIFLLPILIIAFTEELITKILLFFYEAVLLRNFVIDKTKPMGY